MGSTGVRQRDAAATTTRLLAAARAEFAEHGYQGARIERISAASGLNRGLLFQRFGDKEGLYRAVLAAVAQDARRMRSAITARRTEPRDAAEFAGLLRELARATAAFLAGHPEAERILAWERAAGWAAFNAARPDDADPAADRLVEWFRRAADRGWLLSDSPPERQLALVLELVTAVRSEPLPVVEHVVAAGLTPAGGAE